MAKVAVTISARAPAGDDFTACCAAGLGTPIARADAETLARVLKAVADPVRLQLLSLIQSSPGGEACVCDLTQPVGLSQPTISHHLKILTEAGILRREQRATWAWFSIDAERMREIAAIFESGRAPTEPQSLSATAMGS